MPGGNPTAQYNLRPQTYDVFELASLYLRTAGFPDTPTNRRLLAGWFWAESSHSGGQGVVAYNNNPLNITTSSSNYHQFVGNKLHFANYATPQEGATAWANLVKGKYPGIRTALSVQDQFGFPSAVGHSPWGTSAGGVQTGVSYMSHLSADVKGIYQVGGSSGGGTWSAPTTTITFGNASDAAHPIAIEFPTGTPITQDFIDQLTQTLLEKGAFGGSKYQGDFNPVDNAVATTAAGAFNDAFKPLIGQTWGPDLRSPLFKSVMGAAGSQPGANIVPPDITNFFASLNKSNVLHVAAIPAGALLLFFGARLLLGSAGVGTQQQGTAAQSTNTTVVTRYPMIMRG